MGVDQGGFHGDDQRQTIWREITGGCENYSKIQRVIERKKIIMRNNNRH